MAWAVAKALITRVQERAREAKREYERDGCDRCEEDVE